ncbi:hypothetical protein RJ639_036289 [Escallonia herrerae]|uniref:F-box domain-containing protein n=1 Tax=Escallonia herrerae TaxID=1293975 RepID=A0AA88X475_9ASTE|nr:hypothetical protein RJ639_036289 [Escallonia herrerae]
MIDAVLCDELLQEIFLRLPSSSLSAVSLVSTRWLRLLRSSLTSLCLREATAATLPSFLSHCPHLSSLSLTTAAASSADHLLLSAAGSCPNLRRLRFFPSPLSLSSLLFLSTSCPHLSSLSISLSRPVSFHFLSSFPSLKHLSFAFTGGNNSAAAFIGNPDRDLHLDTLSLSGIHPCDYGLVSLWRNTKALKKLKLESCNSVGDNASFSAFLKSVAGLQEVELKSCRSICFVVLMNLSENCVSLNSLLVYDGADKEGLLQFLSQSRCNMRNLNFRLPLDLDNSHLIAISRNFKGLSSLRLQSCCLVDGEGLVAVARGMGDNLEELSLINCDVVEKETGLLTTLGQSLKRLRKLDLSYNVMLVDIGFVSMLLSCNHLRELKLRGCRKLSDAALVSMLKSCGHLESLDIRDCGGIGAVAVELFVLNSSWLRRLQVEASKVSDVASAGASKLFTEFYECILFYPILFQF